MKRIAIVLLAAFAAAAATAQTPGSAAPPASASSVPANPRVAVIDVERLVRDSALGKEAFTRLKKINDGKKADADKLAKEIREMEQKLADQGQSMTEDKREALQKQYQEKAMSFKRFNEDATRELDQAQKKELAELERRVMPVISQVGREKGYTMIFNKFQSGLVFADDSADVTEEVLRRFNTTVAVPQPAKPAPAAAAGPAPTPAPKKN
jgi:outer membrane protein